MKSFPSSGARFLTVKELQSKGWSRRMVTQYLGEPDHVGTRIPGRAGRPGKFYCADRVRRVEAMEPALAAEFQLVRAFTQRNEQTASARMASMLELIQDTQLPVLDQSLDDLLFEVRRSLGTPVAADVEYRLAVEKLLGTFALTVDALDLFSWHAGVCEARIRLRNRFLVHVSRTYPLLGEVALSLVANLQVDQSKLKGATHEPHSCLQRNRISD
ncbi:hypothetical protein [Pseudoduganella sp. R-34]|uniref:hypothetical protein n=1 Tax=Pseudoduganella sp. R-34 TaxID=3404062 RepID=UPI003CF17A40